MTRVDCANEPRISSAVKARPSDCKRLIAAMADLMIYKYLYVCLPWLLGAQGFRDDVSQVLPQTKPQNLSFLTHAREDSGPEALGLSRMRSACEWRVHQLVQASECPDEEVQGVGSFLPRMRVTTSNLKMEGTVLDEGLKGDDDHYKRKGLQLAPKDEDENMKEESNMNEYKGHPDNMRVMVADNEVADCEKVKKGVPDDEAENGGKRENDKGYTCNETMTAAADAVTFMQRKRARAVSPRRRRRARARREEERQRQENRHSWEIGANRTRATTATCSTRPLRAPWWHGASARGRPSRPSAATSGPSTAAPDVASTPVASHGVPDIPPLGEGSANIVWWSEMVGLQDPMLENDRVLDNQTVECIVDNLRGMTPRRRAEMIAQVLRFLGAFLAELLRAINLSQLPAPDAPELIEDDEEAMIQVSMQQEDNKAEMSRASCAQTGDEASLMQKFDASIPFGSKLSQRQGHLNGFDQTQCAQVACHLRTMVLRLRQLAGTVSSQVADRFLRLEALVAGYYTEDVKVPLSLQVWTESQLRILIPYLTGGRTPDFAGSDSGGDERGTETEGTLRTMPATAASSSDLVHVQDSLEAQDAEVPEYRVCRAPGGPWEPATPAEEAEFRAHDNAMRAERLAQEEADALAYSQHEASMAQKWDDWAVRSELDRSSQPPSRKRVRITVCAGTGNGQQIGEACIEGVIDHDQQATVSFSVVETMLGGLVTTMDAAAAHANPQLAAFERDHLPGLAEVVQDFMLTLEGRHWLWQFQHGLVTQDTIAERFGVQIGEAFQLWVAMQADVETEAKNAGDTLLEADAASSSTSSTVEVEKPAAADDSVTGPAFATIRGDGPDGADNAECELNAAEYPPPATSDTLPEGDDSLLRVEIGEALGAEGLEVGQEGSEDACAENTLEDVMDVQAGEEANPPGEPYEAPPGWAGVLRLWNDPAEGAGLPDTMISTGEFEHDVPGGGYGAAAAVEGEGQQAASSSMGGTSLMSSTDASEPSSKQTDLKSWLK